MRPQSFLVGRRPLQTHTRPRRVDARACKGCTWAIGEGQGTSPPECWCRHTISGDSDGRSHCGRLATSAKNSPCRIVHRPTFGHRPIQYLPRSPRAKFHCVYSTAGRMSPGSAVVAGGARYSDARAVAGAVDGIWLGAGSWVVVLCTSPALEWFLIARASSIGTARVAHAARHYARASNFCFYFPVVDQWFHLRGFCPQPSMSAVCNVLYALHAAVRQAE